jgi:glycosyltransferase involved in cell wall biosynthesis
MSAAKGRRRMRSVVIQQAWLLAILAHDDGTPFQDEHYALHVDLDANSIQPRRELCGTWCVHKEGFGTMSGYRMSSLVTICTPVHNGAEFLKECMDSVQAQTYPHLVHVVSDNASSDETAAILASYHNARVPVVTSRSGSLIPQMPNWNRAIDLAPKGSRWVRVLCADDRIRPDTIARVVALGESDPAIGLVGCGHTRNEAVEDMRWGNTPIVIDGHEACRRYFENCGSLMGPHVLVRRDLLYTHGRPFDESLVLADNDMCLRVLQNSAFAFDPEPLGFTREHEGTVSSDVIATRKLHFFEWLLYLDRYGPNIYSPEKFAKIRKIYLHYYVRKMLLWPRNVRAVHLGLLSRYGVQIERRMRLKAIGNWFGKRFGLQEAWVGYPF